MATETKKQTLIRESLRLLTQYHNAITLRQLYYRLVSEHVIPNNLQEYKYLSATLADARRDRLVPYTAFEDLSREFTGSNYRYERDPLNAYEAATREYENAFRTLQSAGAHWTLDKWHGQPAYVEVWCEKQALTTVFEPICNQWDITYGAAKGMPSLSWLYDAAQRIKTMQKDSPEIEQVVILYYGDYDPAGLDIHRQIEKSLRDDFGLTVQVLRRAITQEQIDTLNIPPMPTKTSDSRSGKWIEEHGNISCVELDAIEPNTLSQMIDSDIREYWDDDTADDREQQIQQARALIKGKIAEYIKSKGLDSNDEDD